MRTGGRVHRFCFASILFTLALNAQKTAAKRWEPPKPEAGSIEGRVISGVSGEGVKNAEIVVYGRENQRYTTRTGSGGGFAMPDIEPGRYRLEVSKRGYARFVYGAHRTDRPGAMLSVDSGQHVSNLVLPMSPQGVITGRVLDEDGDPVPYIEVQLLRYGFHHGKRHLEQSDGGQTDDLGEFRLFGLSPGRYYLSAESEAWQREGFGTEGFAPTYYPRTTDTAGATAIDVRPGSLLRGVDITLIKARTVRVRGRVVDPTMKQTAQGLSFMQGVGVQLEPRTEFMGSSRSFSPNNMDAQGNFEIRSVVPGAYFIQAFKRTQGKQYFARQAIDAGQSDIENIVLELSPAAEIKGQLHLAGRSPASLSDAQISLNPPPGVYYFGWPGGSVKADGSFTISNVVTATHYELNVNGLSEDYYVKSARLGDTDILDAGVEFTSSVSGRLDVFMSSNGGEVEGVVLNADDQPAKAATVELVPDEPHRARSRLYRQASTDQYGRFLIKGVAPGGYKLFAWEDIIDGQYEDPEFMKSYETLGQPVAIRELSHDSAQLTLIAAEKR
jgi:protocatechuate 3,4-dioxygenase beta subunit